MTRGDTFEENKLKMFGLVIGQCTTALCASLKGEEKYDEKNRKFDAEWLLRTVKKITAGVDSKRNTALSLHKQILMFMAMRQGATESDDDFLTRFNARAESLELAGGGHIFCSPDILKKAIEHVTTEEIKEEKERFKAICFLARADETQYGSLMDDLKQSVIRGHDEYPTTLAGAYDLLVCTTRQGSMTYKLHNKRGQFGKNNSRNFTFAQRSGDTQRDTDLVPGTDGVTHPGITCYGCNKTGNYSGQFTEKNGTKRRGNMLAQNRTVINNNWLLLDTCSTNTVTNKFFFVKNLRKCSKWELLTVDTNRGSKTFNHIGVFKLLPVNMHFCASSIATILSMKDIANIPGVRIKMDTALDRTIFVEYKGKSYKFKECDDGLYYLDVTDKFGHTLTTNKNQVEEYSYLPDLGECSFLQTVNEKQSQYTKRQIKLAEKARQYKSYLT